MAITVIEEMVVGYAEKTVVDGCLADHDGFGQQVLVVGWNLIN